MPAPTKIAPAPTIRTPALRLAPVAEPVPRRAIALLIGTPQTIRALAGQLEALEGAPIAGGCILLRAEERTATADLGVPLLGCLEDLPSVQAKHNFRTAIVSLPRVMHEAILRTRQALRRAGIAERFVPPITDFLGAEPDETAADAACDPADAPAAKSAKGRIPARPSATWQAPTSLDLAALIGRTPHDVDRQSVSRILAGKRILVTGAGGSIGSHLAQVGAAFNPEQLILMERSENALFEIDRQIGRRFPGIARRAILHDVVDADQTLRHLDALHPHVVFHAAAHKHVPLMEDHPAHAVTNNLFGTKSIADASVATGVERFVMISSDKAVNPTSVMGATKRLAEIYVRSLARAGSFGAANPTRLSMVRFGNVLGSACSVLTIWSAQLAEGGPITVTDPRMTRFFMTIPEAATLVIQSAALDAGTPAGDAGAPPGAPVYVLDMGRPIGILDLAKRFVRAHGLEPNLLGSTAVDGRAIPKQPRPSNGTPTIDIVFTGARPGEKIHEELVYAAEMLRPTAHPGISAWGGPAPEGERGAAVTSLVADLSAVRMSTDRQVVLAAIRRHVPEMTQTSTE